MKSIGHAMTRARGFTLVEVLIALIVLSIGLLGIASLQLSSLRWNHGASMRSQATLLAYDIVDRMRVNQVAANSGEYNIAFGSAAAGGTVAGDDLLRWKQNLATTLPEGDGSVTRVPSATSATYEIRVQWNDQHAEAAVDPGATTLVFMLRTQI